MILESAAVQLSPANVQLLPGVGGTTVQVAVHSSPDAAPGLQIPDSQMNVVENRSELVPQSGIIADFAPARTPRFRTRQGFGREFRRLMLGLQSRRGSSGARTTSV